MANRAHRWRHRAPRYILRPEDNQFVRFAQQNSRKSFGIELKNISSTGLAFSVQRDQAPRVGETIIIEFEAPGKTQMACYSRVVRLEAIDGRDHWSPNRHVMVAVVFLNLPRGHQATLNAGLHKKFDELRAYYARAEFRRRLQWLSNHFKLVLAYAACILALLFVFYFLTQPRGNYTKYNTVPWGSRSF